MSYDSDECCLDIVGVTTSDTFSGHKKSKHKSRKDSPGKNCRQRAINTGTGTSGSGGASGTGTSGSNSTTSTGRTRTLTLEKFCGKTVKELIDVSGVPLEANTRKISVLSKVAPAYYEKKLISKQTLHVVSDPRFVRLYKSNVRDLQKMLSSRRIICPKQGKGTIASICYENNLDTHDFRSNSKSSDTCHTDNSGCGNDGSGNGDDGGHGSDGDDGDDGTFIKIGNDVYFSFGSTQVLMTDEKILRLMSLKLS